MINRLLRAICLFLLLWSAASLGAQGVHAQQPATAIEGGAAAASDPADPVARAVELATESGLGVIIVDGSGRLTGTGETPPSTGASRPSMEGASSLMKAQSELQSFRQELRSRLEALPYSIFEMNYILRQTSPDGRIMTYVEVLGWSLLFLMIGRWLSVEIYGKRIAKRYVQARIKAQPEGYYEKMPFLVFRFLMGVGGTLFAMVFALAVSYLIFGASGDSSIEFTVTAIYTAFFVSRTVSDLWRMVLSPYLSQYRMPVFSDRDAKRLYISASLLATYDVFSLVFATWVGDFGLNYNVYALVSGILALVGTLGSLVLIAVNARAISNGIRAGRPKEDCSWLLRVLSILWAPALVIYVIFGWLNLAFDLVLEREMSMPLMAGTYMVLTSILVVYGVINYGIEAYGRRSQAKLAHDPEVAAENAEAEISEGEIQAMSEGQRHPIASIEDLARRVAGILSFLVGAYALVLVWNPEAKWMKTSAAESAFDVIVIFFLGYIVYHAARIWIDSKIQEETGDVQEAELGDEGGHGGASRLATLLPLFRGVILAVVVVAVVLIVLMELGINVSPLFAGAGVVGLAVGFGSQTLVRDIFSGAFFLMDDAFRKGEYIDIGEVKGTVEKISVRSFQLRHHLGALHTIPFGEIKVLSNYSRDWVMMKLPLRVTYDTDVDKVRKMIKKLGNDLLSDPVIGDSFMQPLKSQGVIEMQDSAMIIRVKFMTKPGDQWLIRKRVYQDIRELFAREGIKFAHREVTVRLAEDQADDIPQHKREAIAGGVQAAIDEDIMDVNGAGDDR
ncbi:mechanosensitive ion channel family protein [Pseudophaeobacter flagellatus]|uniref:mechanosensitive ion channel family protein n=1 Tax=Pseudophaeobacter flagellatus TaxID=2899119 RepID=UPI001E40E5AF|nr:mechanosensitive ion channel family protein [Pseudophaeobacter flagellatus]MCD9149152.1 mechanosensitive ion channel family protein [Pseudophaeobacter flagellatus]